MSIDQKIKILSSWCAVSPEIAKKAFPALVATQQELANDYDAWQEVLSILDAPQLTRMLNLSRARRLTYPALDLGRLTFANDYVLWDGQPIGLRRTYYKTVLPYEAQTRVAYDIFFDRFVAFVGRKHKAVALQHNDLTIDLFVPAPNFDLELVWPNFVEDAFSVETMQRYFARLVNTIKMTDKGFGALDVPIINETQAKFLAAFYLVNLQVLQKGDAKRQRELAEEQQKLKESASEKEEERILKKIEALESELETRLGRYGPLYEKINLLRAKHLTWMGQVEILAKSAFTPTAGTQISKATAKIGKAIHQLDDLITPQFFQIPLLLSSSPTVSGTRSGGDTNTKVCYGCGREFNKKETAYSANKFIFQSPSQRLQSGGSQTQPKVCAVCATVSFISPVKLGSGRLIVRMAEKNDTKSSADKRYLVENELRMLTMGELGLVAGKYVVLKAGETIGTSLISDKLGGLQYAIYKVGVSFEPEVFEQFDLEALFETEVQLKSRHLVWLHFLDQVFEFRRCFGEQANKSQFAAFGQAIRYIQQEEVIFAIYTLLKSGLAFVPLEVASAVQLEKLRQEHVRWLEMDEEKNKAQFYKDVAAMTGLLYAFCSYVRTGVRKAGGDNNKQRIEVRKVIERSSDPYQFDYTVAGTTESETATLFRQADLYYSYEQLKVLLEKLGVNVVDREKDTDSGQPKLQLFFDDVINAYTYFFDDQHYKTTKQQRDFTYALKLSLHARFADLIEADKKETE
jgi:hypothetical protein